MFTGWVLNQENQWQRVCQATTLPRCVERLHRAADRLRVSRSRCVVTGGMLPKAVAKVVSVRKQMRS
jgi:hypothetical protein